jgi:hypothetical protein
LHGAPASTASWTDDGTKTKDHYSFGKKKKRR